MVWSAFSFDRQASVVVIHVALTTVMVHGQITDKLLNYLHKYTLIYTNIIFYFDCLLFSFNKECSLVFILF
ncbi:UNVERIFIED_CONTAM: hypothetical protein NCL1_14044 [Trichonephila clavipes]